MLFSTYDRSGHRKNSNTSQQPVPPDKVTFHAQASLLPELLVEEFLVTLAGEHVGEDLCGERVLVVHVGDCDPEGWLGALGFVEAASA